MEHAYILVIVKKSVKKLIVFYFNKSCTLSSFLKPGRLVECLKISFESKFKFCGFVVHVLLTLAKLTFMVDTLPI